MYYNYNNLFSRNAMFNFIIGERGVGKTYGILKKVVKDFIKTKDIPIKRDPATNEILEGPSQFVYLRRYKTELKNFKTIFEPLVINGEFGDHEITVKGDKVYVDNQLAGYGFAASNAVTLKSSTFPLVDTIVFDEFIIDKGNLHYLQNEVDKFLEVYETIARMRDVKVYFLGNAITIANPYFEYWDLNIPFNSEFRTYKDGLILVNYIKNEEYRKAKKKTKFGKILEGTHYGEYAIDNQFLRDNKEFIKKKTGICLTYCTFIIGGKNIGVWKGYDGKDIVLYCSEDIDPNNKIVIALTEDDHTSMSSLPYSYRNIFATIHLMWSKGLLRFDNSMIKSKILSTMPTSIYKG